MLNTTFQKNTLYCYQSLQFITRVCHEVLNINSTMLNTQASKWINELAATIPSAILNLSINYAIDYEAIAQQIISISNANPAASKSSKTVAQAIILCEQLLQSTKNNVEKLQDNSSQLSNWVKEIPVNTQKSSNNTILSYLAYGKVLKAAVVIANANMNLQIVFWESYQKQLSEFMEILSKGSMELSNLISSVFTASTISQWQKDSAFIQNLINKPV